MDKDQPGTLAQQLMATIHAMGEERTLPKDKTMDKVFTKHQAIKHMEGAYTYQKSSLVNSHTKTP